MQSERRKRVVLRPNTVNGMICRTCRLRKTRCDGQQPVCGNCTKAGKVCGGFTTWSVPLLRRDGDSTDIPQATSSTSFVPANAYEANERLEDDDGRVRLFPIPKRNRAYIDDDMRHCLNDFMTSGMQLLLRASPLPAVTQANVEAGISLMLDEPMFLHAIAAIAIVQKAPLPVLHTSLLAALDHARLQPALHHYCNALYQSRQYFARAPQGLSSLSRMILINWFLVLFELCQGDWVNARRHRRFCLAILNEHQQGWGQMNLESSLSTSLMTGNASGQLSVIMNLPVPQLKDASTETLRDASHLSSRRLASEFYFPSIEEAATCLEALIQNSKDFQQELLARVESACKRPTWKYFTAKPVRQRCLMHSMSRLVDMDSQTQQRQTNLIENHARWKRAFHTLSQGRPPTYTELLCEISFFASWCSISMCRWIRELPSDEYTAAFVHALDLVEREQYLRTHGLPTERYGPELPPASHTASIWEFGVLPTLYTISLKCRVRSVRWKAVQMLRELQRVENFRNSSFLAEVAATVVCLEQDRASTLDARAVGGELPEQARFLDVVVGSRPDEDGLVDIVCGRVRHESDGKLEFLEYKRQAPETLVTRREGQAPILDGPLPSAVLSCVLEVDLSEFFLSDG